MTIKISKIQSTKEMQHCMDIRLKVFVQGQNVPLHEEVDGKDEIAEHYLLTIDDQPCATARVRRVADYAKIERVAVLDTYQGKGLGQLIMKKIISDYSSQRIKSLKLSSQVYAIPFYEKLGFKVSGEEYMDAGIPHKDMYLDILEQSP